MSETDEQKEIIAWYRAQYPKYAKCLRVSQSGRRSGSSKRAAIAWASQVAMGAVTGEADIAILLPRGKFGSLLVEHKAAGAAHKATDDQVSYVQHHCDIGNCGMITRGVDTAKAAIKLYMELDTPSQETVVS